MQASRRILIHGVLRSTVLILLMCAALSAGAQERDRSTGEIVALGLNGYLVFLEISEIGDSQPSRWLGRIGAATGIVTLGLKSYDGGLFSGLLTTAALADTALGLGIVIRAERGGGRKLTLGPVIRPTPDGPAAGLALRFHQNLELEMDTKKIVLDYLGDWLSGDRAAARAPLAADLRFRSPDGKIAEVYVTYQPTQ